MGNPIHLERERDDLEKKVVQIEQGDLNETDLKERSLLCYKLNRITRKITNVRSGKPEHGLASGAKRISFTSTPDGRRMFIQ